MAALIYGKSDEADFSEDLANAFQEVTGQDPKKVRPEVGLSFDGRVYKLEWHGFMFLTPEQAETMLNAMQFRTEIELR